MVWIQYLPTAYLDRRSSSGESRTVASGHRRRLAASGHLDQERPMGSEPARLEQRRFEQHYRDSGRISYFARWRGCLDRLGRACEMVFGCNRPNRDLEERGARSKLPPYTGTEHIRQLQSPLYEDRDLQMVVE